MAAHKQHSTIKFKPACQKMFSKITAQNFEILSNEEFEKVLKTNPDYCCKKCAKLK